jgi:hypothetical protein
MTYPSASATLQSDAEGERAVSTTATIVAPLDYRQFRLMAECAEGTDLGRTQFVFDNGKLSVIEPGAALDTEILVTAENGGRLAQNTVSLQVLAGQSSTLTLKSADAVFWSDAAVQKFLFPYIASCAGHEAALKLAQVQGAWNFYPAREVTVYALVHTIPQAGEPLGLGSIIQVVYTLAGSTDLIVETLDRFATQYPPVRVLNTTPQPQVSYWRGQQGTPPQYPYPDYLTLRAMAEYASSMCEEAQYFILSPPGVSEVPPSPSGTLPQDLAEGTIVIPVYNPTVPAGRAQLGGVWLEPPTGGNVNLSALPGTPGWPSSADALFWSTGAAEQFLFPYYASKGGFALSALADLAEMAESWELNVPIDLGPDRQPIIIQDGSALQVSGLIHMPTSEWTQVETGEEANVVHGDRSSPAYQVGVVFAPAQGQVQIGRVNELSARGRRG